MSYADYLRAEDNSELRHEFFGGELWAMTGATYNHALITMNLGAALHRALRGGPCRVVSESARVFFPALGEAAYPDLRVVCGGPERHPDDPLAIVNPTLVARVLSDGTERFDRGETFAKYRTLPALQAWLLVNQRVHRLELYERNPDGTWTLSVAEAGATLHIPSLGIALAVADAYEGVELDEKQAAPR